MLSETRLFATVFLLVILLTSCKYKVNGQENTGMSIPDSLKNCYADPELYSREKRLPMTMSTLIELIRKVELYKGAYFDLQSLSIALLHRFRMDGIERMTDVPAMPGIIPFRLTGKQYSKHRILFHQLIPGNAYSFPNESLTAQELCTLHFMLSSGVEPWERGDEMNVCPYNLHEQSTYSKYIHHHKHILIRDHNFPVIKIDGSELSRCPIEEGVVHTNQWGTVSPGIVIAAVAAAMEPQQVQIALLLTEPHTNNTSSETDIEIDIDKLEKFDRYLAMSTSAVLDNVWSATLAGDLAEVAVFQGPSLSSNLFIGPSGEWNDTALPHIHYMDQKNYGYWQMTDAEARGGIDGLILASQVQAWEERMGLLRLSQILDMYYSDRGVNFDPKYRACERRSRLNEVLRESNLLQLQTTNFARVLSYNTLEAVHITDEKLQEFSQQSVQAFNNHKSNLLNGLYCEDYTLPPRVHLNVILDGTWTKDDALRVLVYLAEQTDVSYYGSSMAVMNGNDGTWILEETRNASDLLKIRNETSNYTEITWPTHLDLKLCLARYNSFLAEKVETERNQNIIGDLSHVILVLGYSATISDDDFETSKDIIRNFKLKNPDVRFAFLASDVNYHRFRDLSMLDLHFTDIAISSPDSGVETVVTKIVNEIVKVPGRIMSAYCDERSGPTRKEFEDYVTPGYPLKYRIHPVFLQDTNWINLKFQGSNHGDLKVFVSRDEKTLGDTFYEVKTLEESTIKILSPCATNIFQLCPPLFITVAVTSSLVKCSEEDCRYPDQVRFLLRHDGLKCVQNPDNTGGAVKHTFSIYFYVIIQTLYILLIPVVANRF